MTSVTHTRSAWLNVGCFVLSTSGEIARKNVACPETDMADLKITIVTQIRAHLLSALEVSADESLALEAFAGLQKFASEFGLHSNPS